MVWIGRCPITDKAEARSDEGRLPLPSEATTLLFFWLLLLFSNIFTCPSETHPLTSTCQDMWEWMLFSFGQRVDDHAATDTPQYDDHR